MATCSSDVRLLNVGPEQGTDCSEQGAGEQQQVASSNSHLQQACADFTAVVAAYNSLKEGEPKMIPRMSFLNILECMRIG
jgi:hypothetical protein